MTFIIDKIIIHPDYQHNLYYNDIALVKLFQNVPVHQRLRPACLWQSFDLDTTAVFMATGYGALEFGGRTSTKLQKVQLPLYPGVSCKELFKNNPNLPDGLRLNTQLCAWDPNGKQDTCQVSQITKNRLRLRIHSYVMDHGFCITG